MKLIINEKEFDIYSKEVPKEVVGYNFYSLSGKLYGRENVGQSSYPRANYRIIVNLNGKEVELPNSQNLFLTDDGNYFIGKEI